MNLDWLIIGGGIHGVHIAARLIGEAQVSPDRLRIIDPGEHLLERWRTCTATTGMTHLRSPAVHHLDLDPFSLQRFAGPRKNRKRRRQRLFVSPFDRPNLDLFNAHCDQVIDTYGLTSLHIRARATDCSVNCDGVRTELSNGLELTANYVVLAIGASEQPHWPDWAPRNESRIQHAFDKDFDGWPSAKEEVAVVGGGISAGQMALRLVNEGHRVHLISRHALREHQFDSAPGWLGPKLMAGFKREKNVDRRRALITKARYRGSAPAEVCGALRCSISKDKVRWHEDEIETLDLQDTHILMRLKSGASVGVQRILLATGFRAHRPGGTLMDQLIESAALPCADCGYPIVDSSLRWHPRVYVSGPLAELELGPFARNIAGARRAGDRLMKSLRLARATHASAP